MDVVNPGYIGFTPMKYALHFIGQAFCGVNVSRGMLVNLRPEVDEYYLRNGALFFDLKILMIKF